MLKIYEKSELTFALLCIGVYCVLQSLANPLNQVIGIRDSASAVFCFLQAAVLLRFLRKHHLQQRYGLCKSPVPARQFLYYLPLLLIMTRNFWNGVAANFSLPETICCIICMLCVGFVEEVIFRGLLFRALAKDNVKTAILISSITFGLGHLLNLINGSGMERMENLFQVTGAVAIGFLFVIVFYRGGSLFPCILAHAFINSTSVFSNEAGLTMGRRMTFHMVLLVITIAYAAVLTKTLPHPPGPDGAENGVGKNGIPETIPPCLRKK